MILDLVRDGKRVGVTAMSHKVIANLLIAVARAAEDEGATIRIGQRASDADLANHAAIVGLDNAAALAALADGTLDVVGGTSWLWSRDEMAGSVDVLFVDEAGQMSLANVLATAQAGASLVLLGDPQQLEQPLRGTHPEGAARSALAHLLGPHATMPPELGLFLETTWRLHPDLCRFTSTVFYDGRLEPEPHLVAQDVLGSSALSGTGQRLSLVPHTGNDSLAQEEVERVASLAEELVNGGLQWVDRNGQLQVITWQEILIVAPYNAQVGALQRRLPGARVGTVDKFQGQEAPVVVYSTATSSIEDAPRGMDFLFSRHRLNVATSRARCLTMIVASPELFTARARTAEQMRLANAFCRYLELVQEQRNPPAP